MRHKPRSCGSGQHLNGAELVYGYLPNHLPIVGKLYQRVGRRMLIPSQESLSKRKCVRSVALYYAIAIGWAWLVWAPLTLGADGLKVLSIRPSIAVLTCIATLGPTFGCFVAHRLETGNWHAILLLPQTRGRWVWV